MAYHLEGYSPLVALIIKEHNKETDNLREENAWCGLTFKLQHEFMDLLG
ncbi:hypothetical protein SAMN02745181_0112 [Rubritalea squalenifaciens DSM 18772]|uniref:Uncharacterized protein n=1 Tax=Rubritalea squalenifaciens DSM 18772 TaxID=1123071 RepID=A0A1M6B3Z8_9BACT|nr:hypothetical protein SAMN02745181_0112 [Rubritalea squalenifaciens DSM 18772]